MDISIIIPTYNRLWSLPKTISSCRNNKCAVEIIVIDDGSTDGTWEWLKNQEDITAIHTENLGKCPAVNKGFELASGRYIRFLDSDDMLKKKANDEQFKLAVNSNADLVTSGYKLINANDEVLSEHPWTNCDDFIAQQLGECDGSHYSAFIFKKSFINDIPHRPDFAYRDDRLLILEVALKNPAIAIHTGTALLHRVHVNDSLQKTSGLAQSLQNQQHYHIYRKILSQLEHEGKLTQRRKDASLNVLYHLAHWMAKSNIMEAEKIYKWVYELNPDFKPTDNKNLNAAYKIWGFAPTERLLNFKRRLGI